MNREIEQTGEIFNMTIAFENVVQKTTRRRIVTWIDRKNEKNKKRRWDGGGGFTPFLDSGRRQGCGRMELKALNKNKDQQDQLGAHGRLVAPICSGWIG